MAHSTTTKSTTLNRRRFAQTTGAIATASLLPLTVTGNVAAAQATPSASPAGATPDPNATFTVASPTREESIAKLKAAFPFEEPANTGGDLIQVFNLDIKTVNPVLRGDLAATYITSLLFETLVQISPIDGTYYPGLADSWEVSSDGLVTRFTLNPNATFHDGNPVTADDVLYSFEATLSPDGLSPRRADIDRVLASVTKIDDHTVEFTAKAPIATFLDQTVGAVPIIAKHIWEDVPFAEWPSNPGTTGQDPKRVIGSGPFTFVEWVQEDHITVARNENYWLPEQKPVIDRYIYRMVADAGSALQSLRTGEADIANISAAQTPGFIQSNPEFQITEYSQAHMNYYMTNMDETKTPLFTDVRVRQAMVWALDRDLIAEQVWLGYAKRADGSQPPLSPAHAPEEITSIYTYDPEKAKQLLDEAGWVPGSDGIRAKDSVKFSCEAIYSEGYPTNDQMLPYVQQCWKEVGLDVQIAGMPFPALQELNNVGDFEICFSGFTFGSDGNQGAMYRCDSTYPAGYNFVKYCNPEYDRLDDEQVSELDPARRRELLIAQANILADDVPNTPVVFANGLFATSPTVHNFFPTGYTATWAINWLWVDQEN